MDRRHFIKLTAITGTTGALAACGNPEHTLIRFVPDEAIEPGIAVWKPSVCPLCANGCGLTVRVMDADVEVTRGDKAGVVRKAVAKKLDGNVHHPVNRGGLCPRGQAAIQVTYHPDRIAQPLKRSGERGDGKYVAISWDQAIGELTAGLDRVAAAGRQQALAYLTRAGHSQRRVLTDMFLSRFGAPPALAPELFSDDVLRRANGVSFGRAQLPTIDLARSRFVLSFGADFLGTWNSPVAHSVRYGEMRQGRLGIRGVFVQVEARMSQTGASADDWIPAAPGTEGVLALGIAHVIMAAKLGSPADAGRAGRLIEGWAAGLPDYTPERVQAVTGVPAHRLERLARQFGEIRPAVAVVSGPPLGHTNALFTALAVNALTALVGGVEQPGGLFFTPSLDATPRQPTSPRTWQSVAAEMLAGSSSGIEAVLIDGVNPVFTSPPAWRVREALQRVPFIASFTPFIDETSVLADLILPDHSFLESWVDALPESGSLTPVASVAGPVMRPLYDTRATPDVLIDVAKKLQRPLTPALPASFEAMLQGAIDRLQPGAETWAKVTADGGWWGERAGRAAPEPPSSRTFTRSDPSFDGSEAEFPFHLLPYPSQAFGEGATAHLPWLQEMPDPLTSAMWSSWVEVSVDTATKLSIAQGDVIEITSTHGTLRVPAIISPGLAPNVIAMPVGQGHRTFTRYASGRGENPVELLAPLTEPETKSLAWAATRVRIARVGESDGRLIVFAGGMREAHPEARH